MGEAVPRVAMLVVNDATRDARVRKEAVSAARAGYEVVIVALQVGDASPDEVWQPEPGIRIRIRRVGTPMRGVGNAVTRRVRNYLDLRRIQRALALTTALAVKPDLIHANDFDSLPAGIAVKRVLGVPLLYDSHELYVELFKARDGLSDRIVLALQKAVIRAAEARALKSVDAVVTVNPLIAEELERRYSIPRPRVVLNAPPSVPVEPLALQDVPRPIFLYQGGFHPGRGLMELVDAFGRTKRGSLMLMGFGMLETRLRNRAAKADLEGRVFIVDAVAQDQVVNAAASADVGLIPYRPVGLNNVYASPNKLFDYLHAGIAILASDLPFVSRVIEQTRAGVVVDSTNVDEWVREIDRMAEDPESVRACALAARAAAPDYTWEAQEAVLIEEYGRLLAV